VNWFFAKAQGEGTIKVTVKWAGNSASATAPGTEQDPGRVTSGGQAAVARATAAVFIDGRPAGSAIVVDPRYLLTAAHVLLCLDSGTGAKVPVDGSVGEF
jgi:hypothetical protein